MPDFSEWDRLDGAGFRVTVKRSVRRLAWLMAGVGVVATVCGIAAPFMPLVVVGLVLALAGGWNLYRPTVDGLLVDGVAVILTGGFQVLAFLWAEDGKPGAGKWLLTGVLQIVWGVRRLGLWRTARNTPDDPGAMTRLEAIVRDLSRRKPGSDPDIVEFRTGFLNTQRNRLGLYAEGVVGLLGDEAVRLEKRSDIWIEARGTTATGRKVKVAIQMSDLNLTGQMSTEHFERFERWKLGMSSARQIAA